METYSQHYVNDLNLYGRTFRVVAETREESGLAPEGGGGLEGVFRITHRQMERAAGIRDDYGRDIHQPKQELKKIPSATLQQVGAIRRSKSGSLVEQ